MIKIEIREAEGVPVCGDGCCHEDGLIINKIVNDKWEGDEFYGSDNKQETERIVELMKWLYGVDNVKFTALKK